MDNIIIIIGFTVNRQDFIQLGMSKPVTLCENEHEHDGQKFCVQCGEPFTKAAHNIAVGTPAYKALKEALPTLASALDPEDEFLLEDPEGLDEDVLDDWWIDDVLEQGIDGSEPTLIRLDDDSTTDGALGILFESPTDLDKLHTAVEPVTKLRAALGFADRPIQVFTQVDW